MITFVQPPPAEHLPDGPDEPSELDIEHQIEGVHVPIELARAMEGPRAAGAMSNTKRKKLLDQMQRCGGRPTKKHSEDGPRLIVSAEDLERFLAAQSRPPIAEGATPDWGNRSTGSLEGWINELATLGDHPKGMDGWLRSAIRTIAAGLRRYATPAAGAGGDVYDGVTTHPEFGGRAAASVPAGGEVPAGAPFGIIDPDYARIFTKARILAWQYGYALVMHGSFTRDLDLLLVPWEDRAGSSSVQPIINMLAEDCSLRIQDGSPSDKPHGRKCWTLLLPGFTERRWVDLSVMPTVTQPPTPQDAAPAGRSESEQLETAQAAWPETDFSPSPAAPAVAVEAVTLLNALTELVAVKDIKERAEALHFAGPLSDAGENWKTEYDRLRADYILRQPKAWDAAREAIAAPSVVQPTPGQADQVSVLGVTDAERYQWLRNKSQDYDEGLTPFCAIPREDTWGKHYNEQLSGDDLDREIDAAILSTASPAVGKGGAA